MDPCGSEHNIRHDNSRPFPSSPGPLCQNEVKYSAFDVEMIFHLHANITHFHVKGCTLGLILKVRVCGTQKWAKYINIGLYKFWGCKIFTGPKKLQVEKEALTGRAAKAVYLSLHTGGVGAL